MAISFEEIIGKPIVSPSGDEIAKVQDLVIDPERGKMIAVLVGEDSFVLSEEILEFSKDKIVIKDKDTIRERKESLEVQKVLKQDIKIKGNLVKTVKGDSLGRVKNFEIDQNSFRLKKLFVSGGILKDFLKGELIISSNNIVEITKEAIIVKDIYLKQKKEEEAEELVGAGI